ncbi:MAG: GTPase ObgE, partial [Lysobacterales bacterium]
AEPAYVVQALAKELENFSAELAEKPRWLVINKTDLLRDDDLTAAKELLLEELDWQGPVFAVSAVTGTGTEALGQAVMQELERIKELAAAALN